MTAGVVRKDKRKRIVLTAIPAFMRGDGPPVACQDPMVRDLFNTSKANRGAIQDVVQAKRICHNGFSAVQGPCPFLEQCGQYARDNDLDGVWGGTSAYERRGSTKRGYKGRREVSRDAA